LIAGLKLWYAMDQEPGIAAFMVPTYLFDSVCLACIALDQIDDLKLGKSRDMAAFIVFFDLVANNPGIED
jgi:hypothetical protein